MTHADMKAFLTYARRHKLPWSAVQAVLAHAQIGRNNLYRSLAGRLSGVEQWMVGTALDPVTYERDTPRGIQTVTDWPYRRETVEEWIAAWQRGER
jgi:hypothetical protein